MSDKVSLTLIYNEKTKHKYLVSLWLYCATDTLYSEHTAAQLWQYPEDT